MTKQDLQLLLLSFILATNIQAQGKVVIQKELNLTKLSREIICDFIKDEMNKERIDSLSSSLVLSFGDSIDLNIDLWLYDDELLYSCLNHKYIESYMGYCIFYQGAINDKYIDLETHKYKNSNCKACDSILSHISDKSSIIFKEYDGSVYKVYKSSKGEKVKIIKMPGS
jgi:hypothetical protein